MARQFITSKEEGASLIEYAMLVGLVAVVCLGLIAATGGSIKALFEKIELDSNGMPALKGGSGNGQGKGIGGGVGGGTGGGGSNNTGNGNGNNSGTGGGSTGGGLGGGDGGGGSNNTGNNGGGNGGGKK